MPAGDNATLVELGDVTAEELHAAAREWRARPGVAKVVVGHSSLYVIHGAGSADVQPEREPREHHIRVVFDEGFPVERIRNLRLTVRYLGFRGGFAYLDGWPEELAMPRRPTSRPVKAGSFAVAGTVAGFYPIDTPGGWNVLGHTDAELENAFVPGDVIYVIPWSGGLSARRGRAESPSLQRATLITSPLTTILGVPFDDLAAALAANAVKGNVELLESALIGPRLRFHQRAHIAWCTPDLRLQTREVAAGDELTFGRIEHGLRAYLAIGDEPGVVETRERGDRHVIKAMKGPHETSIDEVECDVTSKLDRVGIRLRPRTPLSIAIPADLKSIGMQVGTVQLHPDGSLVAMGPDHPVTGGYLQPMTVITGERWKLAQLVPGERVLLTTRTDTPSG